MSDLADTLLTELIDRKFISNENAVDVYLLIDQLLENNRKLERNDTVALSVSCELRSNPEPGIASDSSDKKSSKKQSKEAGTESERMCRYLFIRGEKKGTCCILEPRSPDEEFCTAHSRSQQALEYRANESPEAKLAARKFSNENEQVRVHLIETCRAEKRASH